MTLEGATRSTYGDRVHQCQLQIERFECPALMKDLKDTWKREVREGLESAATWSDVGSAQHGSGASVLSGWCAQLDTGVVYLVRTTCVFSCCGMATTMVEIVSAFRMLHQVRSTCC